MQKLRPSSAAWSVLAFMIVPAVFGCQSSGKKPDGGSGGAGGSGGNT